MAHPTSIERRPIKSTWHQYRPLAADEAANLPPGWKRGPISKHSKCENWGFLGDLPWVFTHVRKPDVTYCYPFPVPEPSSAITDVVLPETAYIYARTTRAFLLGRNCFYPVSELPHNILWLSSFQCQHIGHLQLHNKDNVAMFKATGSNYSSPNPIEIVATCKGYCRTLLALGTDWDVQCKKGNSWQNFATYKECYYVLWIEWVDGVAYHKASGAVLAEAWELVKEKELVDLIMG
ncbi:hypothetical protein L13192_00122 [Pyrenophora tritici-repentis]|nr:hypothetical protein L13192_00122 [Pyrenophora tritici-repentis]